MSKIFFSYAWKNAGEPDENRETIVNRLYDELNNDGYQLVRDKADLGYKGFISEFMEQIGKGDKIIIVMSDKYVRSPFCMFELYEIARNCKFEKRLFREKVFPIMYEFIDFTRPAIIEKYTGYWENENKEWESLFQKRVGQLSIEQFSRYNKTKLIWQNLGLLMDWLVDMNTLNPAMLSENNFAIIKQSLGEPQGSPVNQNTGEIKREGNTIGTQLKAERITSLQKQLEMLRKLKDSYEEKKILNEDPRTIMRYESEIANIDSQITKILDEVNRPE